MTTEERLASICTALESAGLRCLVMGGHAVRFYGLLRRTVDYDLILASENWEGLKAKLDAIPLFKEGIAEGNSWRPGDFRRFKIGLLPDGRDEWLEFWRHNHLLSAFDEMYSRRVSGNYGGRTLSFLSLPDLIRSKETERADDWQDIKFLQEFLDQRNCSFARDGKLSHSETLSQISSRIGLDWFGETGWLEDARDVANAIALTDNPISQAILLPFSASTMLPTVVPAMEDVVERRLRATAPLTSMHFSLTEVVRSQYQRFRMLEDREDKDRIRRSDS